MSQFTNNPETEFLLINKAPGPTSHDVIDELRRITGVKRIGHAGTLDPFASGLLIVGVGREATRQLGGFLKMDKEYIATLKLGAVSETYDRTGEVRITNHSPRWLASLRPSVSEASEAGESRITEKNIEEILKRFTGEIEQVPPMYSAKKIAGKKLYELARQGLEVARKPIKVKIYDIELLSTDNLNLTTAKEVPATNRLPELKLKIRCSSGTYIRSLAHDIGQVLGYGAYLEALIRTKIGPYKLEEAIETNDLNHNNWPNFLKKLTVQK